MNQQVLDQQIAEFEQPKDMISAADSPIQAIAKMATAGVGTEIIEQMKGLVEWDDARKAKSEFNKAFSMAKSKFRKAKKSGHNKHLDSKYSLLEDYDDATREALSEFGLSWRHVVKTLEGDITEVTCVLAHQDGHSEETTLQAPSYSMTNNAVNKLQSTGIVTTYLKRMTLAAILGLVSDSEFDNDGQGGKKQELITEEQTANIKALAEEVKADIPKFLKYLSTQCKKQIVKIEDIPNTAFKLAIDGLEAKRKQG